MMDLGEIQAHALKLAARLARIRFDLAALVAELYRHHLPTIRGPEWEAMSEGTAPPSLAWHLAGALDAIEDDRLKPVEDDLRAAAEITAADLEREWRQNHPAAPTRTAADDPPPPVAELAELAARRRGPTSGPAPFDDNLRRQHEAVAQPYQNAPEALMTDAPGNPGGRGWSNSEPGAPDQ